VNVTSTVMVMVDAGVLIWPMSVCVMRNHHPNEQCCDDEASRNCSTGVLHKCPHQVGVPKFCCGCKGRVREALL